MIPKLIHYCWFGKGKKPELVEKCIASWKRFCPDYRIIEWNEENFDISYNAFTKQAYDSKKYAFVSDVARLFVIYTYGGFYLDTDVELIKPLDGLCEEKSFLAFEKSNYVATGLIIGAQAGDSFINENLKAYEGKQFINSDGSLNMEGCPAITTGLLEKHGLIRNMQTQVVDGVKIFAPDYFDPYDNITGKMKKTDNTYSVHWYGQSFLGGFSRVRTAIARPLHRIFGKDFMSRLRKLFHRS